MNYLVIVTVLWAFSFSLIGQYLAGQVDSDFAVLVRVVIAMAVFAPMTVWRGLPSALMRGFWLAGALQFGVTYLCLYRSFTVLTVPEVLLFTVLTPIYVTLLDDALERRFNRWAMLAAAVAVIGGIIIRFRPLHGDYLMGFILLQIANATFAAGQVICRRLLMRYPTEIPMYRFFGHFFLGALVLAVPSWLLFGDPSKLPQSTMQWGVLVYMGLFATALGIFVGRTSTCGGRRLPYGCSAGGWKAAGRFSRAQCGGCARDDSLGTQNRRAERCRCLGHRQARRIGTFDCWRWS